MSVVTVQVGQCGNQLGASLFEALNDHASANDQSTTDGVDAAAAATAAAGAAEACRRSFFRDGGIARAVIIDTEPKVIQRIVGSVHHRVGDSGQPYPGSRQPGAAYTRSITNTREAWSYDSGTQVCCHAQGGAANNWAYGYHGHGAAFAEACLESVRREAERCDRLVGLCILHSAAGGTGSGLGTYLTEVERGMARRVLGRGCVPGNARACHDSRPLLTCASL